MSPPLNQIEQDEQEFFKRRKLFELLIETPGWKELVNILNAQRNTQLSMALAPFDPTLDGTAQAFRAEYGKGVAYGILQAITTPHATINQAIEILRQKGTTEDGKPNDRYDDLGTELGEHAIVRDLSGDDQ